MMLRILTIVIFTLMLQGCFFVVGAAAGAAAIAAVYDHRKVEAVISDEKLANTVFKKIKSINELTTENTHINITCFNHIILLTGETISPALRQKIEAVTHSVPGVIRVYNQLTVKGASSPLSRTSDAWITAKIKSEMLATKHLKSGTIKVLTEDGAVYLMGIVTHNQADTAVEIARHVSGVQKVMKIFQYTD